MRIKQVILLLFISTIVSPIVAQRAPAPKRHSRNSTVYISTSQNNSGYNYNIVYGVAAGVTLPVLKFEGDSREVSGDVGFKGGFMWGVDWGFVEFVPEIWFSTYKMDFYESSGLINTRLKNSSIDMPLMVGFELFGPIKINVGPTFSLICNNTLDLGDGTTYEMGRVKSSVGGVFGISLDLVDNLFVDIRYIKHLVANSYNYYSTTDNYNISLCSVDITAGFRF